MIVLEKKWLKSWKKERQKDFFLDVEELTFLKRLFFALKYSNAVQLCL